MNVVSITPTHNAMKATTNFIGAFLCLALQVSNVFGQSAVNIQGRVVEQNASGKEEPVIGVSVYWVGTNSGTLTDSVGKFILPVSTETTQLGISFVGFNTDTINIINPTEYINHTLTSITNLEQVEVVHRKKTTNVSYLNPIKVETLGEKEIQKAACCNLSESFETNPSVDVSFTDAVTGTRQIQLLGLAGPYTQITRENMPDVRGLSSMYGMAFIPGTWIESIQLNKGAGSVLNGFESVAGQINVELKKPESAENLFLNLYGNEGGRVEANLNLAHQFNNQKWSSGLLLHHLHNSVRRDRNGDGFLDNPLSNHLIALNRWKYLDTNGLVFQLGVKFTLADHVGGQFVVNRTSMAPSLTNWGMHTKIDRYETWSKIGKTFNDKPYKSVGLQVSGAQHNQNSYFGLQQYSASQSSAYVNGIYQNIFGNTNHKYKAGASLQYDDYQESLNDTTFDRTEVVPGAYFEYTFTRGEQFNLVAGSRIDYHNLFGVFVTPRIHLRYAYKEKTVWRASAGRGQRTANILAENNNLFASARQVIIQGDNTNKPYGLNPEVAWNYGINVTRNFRLAYREGSTSIDVYRTDFENQIVIDLDQSPQQVVYYNLQGQSYSNSLQAQIDYELIKRLDVRLAYRWFDVKTTYNGILLQKPLIAAHLAFVNLAYKTPREWKFDYTLHWQGEKRIPNTATNPSQYQLNSNSPNFITMNAQISKTLREKWDVYVGVENILNYKQTNPIVASDQAFSPYFDATLIWGPVFGRNTYFGLRYKIK